MFVKSFNNNDKTACKGGGWGVSRSFRACSPNPGNVFCRLATRYEKNSRGSLSLFSSEIQHTLETFCNHSQTRVVFPYPAGAHTKIRRFSAESPLSSKSKSDDRRMIRDGSGGIYNLVAISVCGKMLSKMLIAYSIRKERDDDSENRKEQYSK